LRTTYAGSTKVGSQRVMVSGVAVTTTPEATLATARS